jgi:hypothetical protein
VIGGREGIEVTRDGLKAAMAVLQKDPPREAKDTTDFLGLFERLNTTHKISAQSQSREAARSRGTSFVVTVISDFKDDPDGGGSMDQAVATDNLGRQFFLAAREREIRKATRDMMSENVAFNFVILSRRVSSEPRIVSYVEQRADWYLFNRFSLLSDLKDTARQLLYPTEPVERPLHLWYYNPLDIQSEARITTAKSDEVTLSLPDESEGIGRFKLTYGKIFGSNAPEVIGVLQTGETSRAIGLSAGESLYLKYSGALPRESEVLRVFVESERRTYLVPMRFVLRLTPKVAGDMLVVWGLIVLPCLAFVGLSAKGAWEGYRSPDAE